MIVDRVVYLWSMVQVYVVTGFLEIGFPLLMWRSWLRGRSAGQRLMFCVLTQTTYLVNVVLLLGFFKICCRWTLLLALGLEYTLVRWTFSDKQFFHKARNLLRQAGRLLRGEESLAALRRRQQGWLHIQRLRLRAWIGWSSLRAHWAELVFLFGVLGYNMAFLTHNVNIWHSYQFSDLPVHISWIYALEQGTLFVDGIYPFAMHTLIYVVRELSGISLREIVLYFGSFHTLLAIVTLYLFAKRLFVWKYSAWFALVCFSLLLNLGRYAASLPQECGVFAIFTMGYYLINYLEKPRPRHIVHGDSRLYRFFRFNQYLSRRYLDLDFFMLTLSVAQVIAFHFYTAIAAVVLAVTLVVTQLNHFLKKQYFVPIITAAVTGAMIAVVPFAVCFASGIPFQASMGWALSVIQGTDWGSTGGGTGYGYVIVGQDGTTTELQDMGADTSAQEDTTKDSGGILQSDLPLKEKMHACISAMLEYNQGYLFGVKTNRIVCVCVIVTLMGGSLLLLFYRTRASGCHYLSIVLFVLLLTMMGAATPLGLPTIFEPTRAAVFCEPILALLLAVPLDLACLPFTLAHSDKPKWLLTFFTLVACTAAGFWIVSSGAVHHYFDVNLAYYNEPDYLIRQIQKQFPEKSYTIVSPTDEYYVAIEGGYHTELSEVVAMTEGKLRAFTLPTRYTFFFIEKYTLQDYFNGPDWVSKDYAEQDFLYQASTQDYYYQRNILESKAYYWAKAYQQLHHNAMSVYYEDDIYIAYLLVQDVNSPLSLLLTE